VLHHFGSRENLMLEIVRHRDEVNRSRFPAEEGQEFEALFDLVAHNAQVPGLIALFSVVSALASADTAQSRRREYFETLYARNRTAWTRRIQRAQSEGVLRDDVDPQTVAGLILATLDGLQTQWLLDPSVDMVRHLRALVQILQARPA
jgi:AcrR family transcriptional regulator